MAMSPWHRQMTTSQKPPDRITPLVEQMEGVNFPYRGGETHGVDPTVPSHIDPEEADYGTTVAVALEPKEDEPEPVPVRIVSEGVGELPTFRVVREYCRGNEPSRRIIGQDEARTTVRIKNLHPSDLRYVSDIPFNDVGMAYPIAGGAELELSAQTSVFAKASGANDVP